MGRGLGQACHGPAGRWRGCAHGLAYEERVCVLCGQSGPPIIHPNPGCVESTTDELM
jgi:hypothetical protein